MVTRAAMRRSLAQIRYVQPAGTQGTVAEVYRQLEADFGMIAPPIALHSPAPDVLAASWLILRETLLANGLVSRAAKEAVAVAVSSANGCPYCVEVHTTALRTLPADPVAREAQQWAAACGSRAEATVPPGPVSHVPELLGVATAFQYLNRMVTIFLGGSPLPPGVPGAVRGAAHWLLAKVMAPGAIRQPGTSLGLLPTAPLPADLRWAAGNTTIAGAFSRACAAVETAAATVPAPVRLLVHEYLANWAGRPAGPGRAWVEDATSALSQEHRPSGRLALLTAIAPYQVDSTQIADVREQGCDDAGLIRLTAWASLTAARRVGTWPPVGTPTGPVTGTRPQE